MSSDHGRKEEGIFPLHEACHQGNLQQVECSLKCGANPTTIDTDGNTALHCASASNQVAILRLLLSPPYSCYVDLRSHYGETPLHVACLNGNIEAATLLVENKADLQARDDKGNSALHLSAASDSSTLVEWIHMAGKCEVLLDSQNKDNDTPAHCAGRLGCRETFSALCKLGANLNLRNTWSRTPLEEASQYNNSQTIGKSAFSDEEEEDNRTNNQEIDSHVRARSQSEPRVAPKAKKQERDQGSSQSAMNILSRGDDISVASAATTSNPDHDMHERNVVSPLSSKSASYIATKQRLLSSVGCASKSATNVEIKGKVDTHATGTPACTYKGTGKKGRYDVTQASHMGVLRFERSHSERLPRRMRDGGEGRREGGRVAAVRACTPDPTMGRERAQSENRHERNIPSRSPESLV